MPFSCSMPENNQPTSRQGPKPTTPHRPAIFQRLAQDPSNSSQSPTTHTTTREVQSQHTNRHRRNGSNQFTNTHIITPPENRSAWPGITVDHPRDRETTHRTPPSRTISLSANARIRVVPHAPRDATEPDSQSTKNITITTVSHRPPRGPNQRSPSRLQPRG